MLSLLSIRSVMSSRLMNIRPRVSAICVPHKQCTLQFQQQSTATNNSSNFKNKSNSSKRRNGLNITIPGLLFSGSIVAFVKKWVDESSEDTKAQMAPVNQSRHNCMSLIDLKMLEPGNSKLSPPDKRCLAFQYEHTFEALGELVKPGQTMIESVLKGDLSWAVIQMLGRTGYGAIKVHHVLLHDHKKILDDLKSQFESTTGLCKLSVKRPNWVWLSGDYEIMTLVWDDLTKSYRVYVYKACVVVEVMISKAQYHPVAIKFISEDNYPNLIDHGHQNSNKTNSFIKNVVEEFDRDMMAFQAECRFIRD